VPLLLKSADLFVFPTHFEGGQSFAIAEAMAYGLPIVTSNASGIPEVIRDRTDGLLFRSGDSCDLLETLRWALRHPEKMREMAESAKQRAQDFTEEKMISKYLEVWKRLSRTIPTV
jgi:glycosyltransferase involved in cell wall biosynthesis